MDPLWMRIRRPVAVLAVVGGLVAVPFVLNAATSSAASAIVGPDHSTVTGTPPPDDEGVGVAAPIDPAAPVYRPVQRPGKPSRPRTSANRGGFTVTTPATFPDGVSVRVAKVTRSVEQGEGPGVFNARPHTALTLTLTNGSTAPIDLSQVVVTTTYGTPPAVASPVYEDPVAADFAGTVPVGGTATATYVFAIPPGQRRSAVTTVDFDNSHTPATFTGLS